MAKKLFLLDGMALVYRAHFALIRSPIYTSKGVNSSALYGFTQTLLEIIKNQQPSHLAVAFDTDAPTQRHVEYPEYKIQREAMPEDISKALPHVRRMIEAFRIPVLILDGWEADDIIGTLVRVAEPQGFESFMVTPDKDFGQLVSPSTRLYKPSRMGDGVEILGVPEILAKWGIRRVEQVIDILALWGDPTDNIPGVPGIGEKTAAKLIGEFDSVENLLAHTASLKGKLKENLETFREQALLSKRLATICCDVPIKVDWDLLQLRAYDEEALKNLFVEFEFNSLGRRLFGNSFRAGRGFAPPAAVAAEPPLELSLERVAVEGISVSAEPPALKRLADAGCDYRTVQTAAERAALLKALRTQATFSFCTQTDRFDPKESRIIGMAFCFQDRVSHYVPFPDGKTAREEASRLLQEFRDVFENPAIGKVGHDLKFEMSVLRWHGIKLQGPLFDTLLAHALIEPDMRHTLPYLSESCLGYELLKWEGASSVQATPTPVAETESEGEEFLGLAENPPAVEPPVPLTPPPRSADCACERADVAWQLRRLLEPLVKEKGQEKVFYELEAPLVPALAAMEFEGIRVDAKVLSEFGQQLEAEMAELQKQIFQQAGREFNLNSPKQLGEILFDELKLAEKPKKTRTGQYATNEQTLLTLAGDHAIVRSLMDYRVASKLKSTYVDTLPGAIWPASGRIHTTYQQLATSTGRLNSQNPNLQNIPIRTARGQEIRKAFVPRNADYLLLSADYSQIELRIIASLSDERAMIEAFKNGTDIHTATAARVYGVFLDLVTPEMRRKAKMVNYGIAYGISAFGLAQRLGIPRKEAATIIEQYFGQFPGIAAYMRNTIESCQRTGYVETVTGRRRYLRDIRSSNATTRGAAERNAINAPIQGTAADMIKLAMINIHRELDARHLKSRLLLQVHDELVFDLYRREEEEVRALVTDKMQHAITMAVPMEVEIGVGENWLAAH